MEKMEKVKAFFMGFFTVICTILLMTIIITFSIKKTSEKYLNEKKIKSLIKNINFADIFINENLDSEHFIYIKNKLTEAGIPFESVNEFIKTEPVEKYTDEIVTKSISNTVNGSKDKLVDKGNVYSFLEKNIDKISEELQEKNVPNSEKLDEEHRKEFLEKIKDKTPEIEDKINELQDKINEKLKEYGYTDQMDTIFKIVRIIYRTIMDFIFIVLLIVFIIGIVITRKSFIKALKWIGIAFLLAAIILIRVPHEITKLDKYIDKFPNSFELYIKSVLQNMADILKDYGAVYLIIGSILILINIIIYIIKEKSENKKIDKFGKNIEIKELKKETNI